MARYSTGTSGMCNGTRANADTNDPGWHADCMERFAASHDIIDRVLAEMKAHQNVHLDAEFNTLAWFAGPALVPQPEFEPAEIVGKDIEAPMIEQARRNFDAIGAGDKVTLLPGDAPISRFCSGHGTLFRKHCD